MASKNEWTAVDVPDQSGKRIVITGANSGIGLEAARVLADRGAHVVMACRSSDKAEAAAEEIRATVPDASLEIVALDLGSLDSVKEAAAVITNDDRPLDTLINNAGIMAVPHGTTTDGFELQLGTNHLGHFAFTGQVLSALLVAETPRVVTVSSNAHKMGKMNFDDLQSEKKYSRFGAYAQSKLANLLFTMELARRFRRAGLDDAISVGCHPGASSTNLASGMGEGRWDRLTSMAEKLPATMVQSAADGALPTLRAATDPGAANGDYYGPSKRFEMVGPASKVKPRRSAFDVHDARGLWEASIELTGVDFAEIHPDNL